MSKSHVVAQFMGKDEARQGAIFCKTQITQNVSDTRAPFTVPVTDDVYEICGKTAPYGLYSIAKWDFQTRTPIRPRCQGGLHPPCAHVFQHERCRPIPRQGPTWQEVIELADKHDLDPHVDVAVGISRVGLRRSQVDLRLDQVTATGCLQRSTGVKDSHVNHGTVVFHDRFIGGGAGGILRQAWLDLNFRIPEQRPTHIILTRGLLVRFLTRRPTGARRLDSAGRQQGKVHLRNGQRTVR